MSLPPPSPLTLEQLLHLVPLDTTPEEMTTLDLKKKQASSLPSQLRMFKKLRKLDVSTNCLRDCSPFTLLSNLTSITLSNNNISSLEGLSPLKCLVVVTASFNNIRSLKGLEGSASSLKALIINDNHITIASTTTSSSDQPNNAIARGNANTLRLLQKCETVVLSRNPNLCCGVEDKNASSSFATNDDDGEGERSSAHARELIAKSHPLFVFSEMQQLKKLSLSECGITSLPQRWFLPMVTELRLAKNTIATIPESVILRSVQVLDVSHNRLTSIAELRRCKFLHQLSASNNPFVDGDSEDERSREPVDQKWYATLRNRMLLTRMFESLTMVDGVKFEKISKEEYLTRKNQEEANATETKGEDKSSQAVSGQMEATKTKSAPLKRPREAVAEPEDVIMNPSDDVVRGKGASIVRREKVQPVRGAVASGVSVLEALKAKQKSAAW